ncbi:MAG: 5-oxoprolinase subunit PxpB [Phycisphaerales bacterium]
MPDSGPESTPALPNPMISWLGDCCLRVSFGDEASDAALARVRDAFESIKRERVSSVIDVTPAYATLLVRFDIRSDLETAEARVRSSILNAVATGKSVVPPLVELPVCYEPAFAPDLDQVASHCGLSGTELTKQHAAANYSVAFIGFTPGFPYLTGLPPHLRAPRHERPRVRVPAGSIGIAGDQTGIYPRETPGGWKLIGRTPLQMFDVSRGAPSLLAPGDRVRFVPIDAAQFAALAEREQR